MPETPAHEIPFTIGVESDVVALQPGMARARFRIHNEGAKDPFPDGDWLRVRLGARLYEPAIAQQGRFDDPLAAGREMDAVARSSSWTIVDLPLPAVFRREYSVTAKVFSADPRYRKPFVPSLCRVVRATFGSVVRIKRTVLEDIYRGPGYANPAAEQELRRWVREGFVVAEQDGRLMRAREVNGTLSLEPFTQP